jgi:hypothetical protein
MADLPFGSLAFVGVYDASRAAKIILGPQGQKETRLGHESNIHIKFIAERIEVAF